MADVQVPEGLPDGVYYFVGEFYAPVKGDSRMGEKNIRFDKPGGILMRKRIPVVIGNPEYSISLSRIITGIPEQYVMKNLGEKRPRDDVEYEFSMPELGIKDTSRGRTNHIYGLVETPCNRDINDGTFDPSALEGREYFIAQIVARHKGNVIGCHFFPMRPEFVGKNKDPFLLWNLHTPGKEYQEKLVEMREKIMSSSRRVSSDF